MDREKAGLFYDLKVASGAWASAGALPLALRLRCGWFSKLKA